ncbi:MAG: cation-translocating P-type ATPase [Chitinivibrionales bacterium]
MVQQSSDTREKPVVEPWGKKVDEVLKQLEVDQQNGLNGHQVRNRLQHWGTNRLQADKKRGVLAILIDQSKSILVIILFVAAVLSFLFGNIVEGIAILAVVVLNVLVGFIMELRAVRSMEALQKLGQTTTTVLREGQPDEISAEQLVPGDIVLIESGDVVTADIRLLEANKLQADESVLTGESMPVTKKVEPIEAEASMADRTNMLYKGTAVTRGSGAGVVVGTGTLTELGRISTLTKGIESKGTLLQKQIDHLGKRLIWLTIGVTILIALVGILAGKELVLIIETAVALAVATVPEGLPIVATIALARGMWRMAQRNALIRRLSAVETLGSTSIILTDKTGTLTENRMRVQRYTLADGLVDISQNGETFTRDDKQTSAKDDPLLEKALRVGVLCNNAAITTEDEEVGEPMEVALLRAGTVAQMDREEIVEHMPEEREEAFDPDTKMMATFHRQDEEYFVAVKGAPEAVLAKCRAVASPEGSPSRLSDSGREKWLEKNKEMAQDGLRVLALASKEVESADVDPYENLILLGLVGLVDPPREDVREAIRVCHKAGIRVVMVTGDQPETARNVAKAVAVSEGSVDDHVHTGKALQGIDESSEEEKQRLVDTSIFARISPEQKLDLIRLHQQHGSIVAMIGDGVNDAPALKKADIGVAMAKRGTQVAKDAADMQLQDDRFATIIVAVAQGRAIFGNIRKFIEYLLSLNLSEVLAVGAASVAGLPLPILPLQILYVNLITDVFPALALGVGEGESNIMEGDPRDPKEPILAAKHWAALSGLGFIIAIITLAALVLALKWFGVPQERAVTISFLTMALSQIWQVLNVRSRKSNIIKNEITRNKWVWGSILLCVGLIIFAAYMPGLSKVLSLVPPTLDEWLFIGGMSLLTIVFGQISVEIAGLFGSKKSKE